MQLGPTPVPLVGQQAQMEAQAVAMTAQLIVSLAQQIAVTRIVREGADDGNEWQDPPDAQHSRITVDAVAAAIAIVTTLAKCNASIVEAARATAAQFRLPA